MSMNINARRQLEHAAYVAIALSTAPQVGCREEDWIRRAEAQPTYGNATPIENIAPGQSVKAGAISLDADANADFLEWNGDGDGVTGDTDLWPIPHGSRLTIKLQDAAEVSCCYLGDPDEATTTAVGAQSSNTTRFNVDGGMEGACFALDGEGDSWTDVVNYFVLREHGFMPSGVCATETANNDNSSYDVYGVCAANADCNNVGGHAANTTCDTTRAVLNYTTNDIPGVYVACRSSAAADISYWITR